MLLLALRTVKVLDCLVDKLIGWGTSDGQVNVLSGAAPGGPSSSFGGVVSVSFYAFDQLASLWVDLGEGVYRVVLASVRIPVALDSSLDKCSKASSALSSVWNAVQVSLTTAITFFDVASVLKNGLFVKSSINS